MPDTLNLGARGELVAQLQFLLAHHHLLEASDVDGIFGPRTDAAVREFQSMCALPVDGVVTGEVWKALSAQLSPPPTLSLGATGPIVVKVQRALNGLNESWRFGFQPLAPDGVFGPQTQQALQEFQTWGGVCPDGICGPQTWSIPIGTAGLNLAGLVLGMEAEASAAHSPAPPSPSMPSGRGYDSPSGWDPPRPDAPSPDMGEGSARRSRRGRRSQVDEALRRAITPGRLLWNPPGSMPFGKPTRVEVRVAVSEDLDDELRRGLSGPGMPRLEDLPVSPFMGVHLRGHGFDVVALSDADQPVGYEGYTTWEFDVTPTARGLLKLQLCVSLRVPIRGRPDERRSIPVLERTVEVQVRTSILVRQFAVRNWQWLLGSVAGLGAVIGAWKGLF